MFNYADHAAMIKSHMNATEPATPSLAFQLSKARRVALRRVIKHGRAFLLLKRFIFIAAPAAGVADTGVINERVTAPSW